MINISLVFDKIMRAEVNHRFLQLKKNSKPADSIIIYHKAEVVISEVGTNFRHRK